MTIADGKRPIVAVLYREDLPPRLDEIEELAEVRLTKADGLAEAMAWCGRAVSMAFVLTGAARELGCSLIAEVGPRLSGGRQPTPVR